MPPPTATGTRTSFLPPLPTNLTTFQEPQALAPFFAVLATVEPILREAHVLAALLATRAGRDLRLRVGSAIAVIRRRYPTRPAGNGHVSARGLPDVAAQPLDGLADALAHADLRPPPEEPLRLLDARPAPDDVDVERRLVLEGERVGVAAALLPDDPREL